MALLTLRGWRKQGHRDTELQEQRHGVTGETKWVPKGRAQALREGAGFTEAGDPPEHSLETTDAVGTDS